MKIINLLIKKRDRVFSKYPCDIFLHNALLFIIVGKPDAAYREICCAIIKSGGKLTEEEQAWIKQLMNNDVIVRNYYIWHDNLEDFDGKRCVCR